jgi:hypothetical protein
MSLGNYGETPNPDDKVAVPGFEKMWSSWDMVNAPFPVFGGEKVSIDYGDEKLIFNKGFSPATMEKNGTKGGKRKTKKINKNRSKKNKKSKCRFCNH